MSRRMQAGERMRVVSERGDLVELESAARLRPGQCIELVLDRSAPPESAGRSAWVVTWCVARLGKEGPVYRGLCRWQ
jgi:hypothetical protein